MIDAKMFDALMTGAAAASCLLSWSLLVIRLAERRREANAWRSWYRRGSTGAR